MLAERGKRKVSTVQDGKAMEDPKPARAQSSRSRPRQPKEGAAPESKGPEAKAVPASGYAIADPAEFASNMVRVGQQSQKLLADYMKR